MVPATIHHPVIRLWPGLIAAALMLACSSGSNPEPATIVERPASTPSVAASPASGQARPLSADEFQISITRQIRYIWPASGPITSYFGPGHPNGIDIALDLAAESPIRSAAAGTVRNAGPDPCCGLGLRVEIDHADGGRSVYGHLDRIDVAPGQRVTQGQVIGLGGNTGDSDGKHLHFELYQYDEAVDPLRYLPADQQSISGTERVSCAQATVRLDPATDLELRILPQTLSGYEVQTIAYTGISVAARELGITAEKRSVLTAVLAVPPLPRATGETLEGGLDFVLASPGAASHQLNCRLVLRTRITLPNPPGTGRHLGGAEGATPPTATPTRTPISGPITPPTQQAAPTAPTPQRPPAMNPTPQRPPVQRP